METSAFLLGNPIAAGACSSATKAGSFLFTRRLLIALLSLGLLVSADRSTDRRSLA